MRELTQLSNLQQNLLIASIIGDGEITKLYPYSRRINNSYREHYGDNQEEYRKWKQSYFPNLFYITSKSHSLRSKSHPLFTELYPYFYSEDGQKKVSEVILKYCNNPIFLAVIYMDDGTLSISRRINDNKKIIYLTPHIYLYLQNYPEENLTILKNHISNQFNVHFKLAKRPDGYGNILRFTSVKDTFDFLHLISPFTAEVPSMFYKTNWKWRFNKEWKRYQQQFPDYQIKVSSSNRNKNYSHDEIQTIIELKRLQKSDKYIADTINRTYWSVVYKVSELRKNGLL